MKTSNLLSSLLALALGLFFNCLSNRSIVQTNAFQSPLSYPSIGPSLKLRQKRQAAPFHHRLRLQNQEKDTILSEDETPSDPTTPTTSNTPNNHLTSAIVSHHVAIKTRNIENAIKFYSLLGFEVETKFKAGSARAAWLIHTQQNASGSNNAGNNANNGSNQQPTPKSRIELIEVPSYMLNEPEGMKRRAIDFSQRQELLGINHLALDVTQCIPRPDNDNGASSEGTACALYQLQEYIHDLNNSSKEMFGLSLRIALEPTKRIIGREVYEMAFLYDADGSLIELLNYSGRLEQEVGDGWEPWDGVGFVR